MPVVVVIVQVGITLERTGLGEDEDVAAGADHLNRRAVKTRQDGFGDDLIDGAERGLTAAEIKHAVDRAEKLVQLMGAKQHGHL